MRSGSLDRRLTRLEWAMTPPEANRCRACGLRHVQPLTIDLARRIIGPVSWMAPGLMQAIAARPAPKLCLCDQCCGDPGDRWFARRSHPLVDDEDTA